jgi:hypothetical protein
VGPVEAFIRAARVDDHAHARPVDFGEALKLLPVVAARDGSLAGAHEGSREERGLLPFQGDRDAAHPDVELLCREIGHEVRPGGRHNLQLHPERLGETVRHLDVEAAVLARALVQDRERPVVAGEPDSDGAARNDLVKPGRWRLPRGGRQRSRQQ